MHKSKKKKQIIVPVWFPDYGPTAGSSPNAGTQVDLSGLVHDQLLHLIHWT